MTQAFGADYPTWWNAPTRLAAGAFTARFHRLEGLA